METATIAETALIVPERLNAIELFTGDAMDPLVAQIRDIVEQHVPDTSTAKGRDEIRSLARKVSSSKVILDELGKNLVADWKEKAKKVDIVRKEMRDELDVIRDRARLPLTNWEQAEEERKQREEQERQLAQAWDDAYAYDALWEREKAIQEKEAQLAREEAERKAKEEADRLEKERQERLAREAEERRQREERIAKEAADKARREAEAAVKREKERAERAEREKMEAEARAKARAEQAERDRIAAEARAKAAQEAAVLRAQQQAREEAERKESQRLAAEKAERDRQEKIAANKRHREKVDREALESMTSRGFTPDVAACILEHIRSGRIKHVTINY